MAAILEVVVGTKYFWVPFEQIAEIQVRASDRLRSRFWCEALLRLIDGSSHGVLLPALYPDSWRNSDDRVRLGGVTRWEERDNGIVIGVGPRLWLFDFGDMALLEVRHVRFDRGAGAQPSPDSAAGAS
jgi:type VI secretion system protein ImpE